MRLKRTLRTMQDTELLAAEIAQWIRQRPKGAGVDIGLVGSLGAGKTTLVREIALLLGFSGVSSPSYVLQNHYGQKDGIALEHWDLYRLKSAPDELHGRTPADTIRIIEWSDRDATLEQYLDLCIELLREGAA